MKSSAQIKRSSPVEIRGGSFKSAREGGHEV